MRRVGATFLLTEQGKLQAGSLKQRNVIGRAKMCPPEAGLREVLPLREALRLLAFWIHDDR